MARDLFREMEDDSIQGGRHKVNRQYYMSGVRDALLIMAVLAAAGFAVWHFFFRA